jgi:hypothetical protein
MDSITATIVAAIETQRVKLKKAARSYAKRSINAFKRLDLEKGISHGAKALAAQQADHILGEQQDRLREANP